MDGLTGIIKFQKDRGLDKQEYIWENEAANILEELLEAYGFSIPNSSQTRGYC